MTSKLTLYFRKCHLSKLKSGGLEKSHKGQDNPYKVQNRGQLKITKHLHGLIFPPKLALKVTFI